MRRRMTCSRASMRSSWPATTSSSPANPSEAAARRSPSTATSRRRLRAATGSPTAELRRSTLHGQRAAFLHLIVEPGRRRGRAWLDLRRLTELRVSRGSTLGFTDDTGTVATARAADWASHGL